MERDLFNFNIFTPLNLLALQICFIVSYIPVHYSMAGEPRTERFAAWVFGGVGFFGIYVIARFYILK